MRLDLHIHTTASDGSWTPSRLIREIKKAGIGLFAVTDHDTAANIAATAAAAREAGLRFIPGVEISSTLEGRSFHILGYGIDASNPELESILRHNYELMEQADLESIQKLIADGLAIDLDEYCAYEHNPERGGWKSLSFLIDKGFCQGVDDFFTQLFTARRGIYFPEFPPPAKAIQAIHAAGGMAVLAHPGSDFHGTVLEETLDMFAAEEIDGIECFHPSHDAATVKRATAWCEQHGLLITGGSDCHGAFVPERRLGLPMLTLADVRLAGLV